MISSRNVLLAFVGVILIVSFASADVAESEEERDLYAHGHYYHHSPYDHLSYHHPYYHPYYNNYYHHNVGAPFYRSSHPYALRGYRYISDAKADDKIDFSKIYHEDLPGRKEIKQKLFAESAEKVKEKGSEASEKVKDKASDAKEHLDHAGKKIKDKGSEAKDKTKDAAAKVDEKAKNTLADFKEKLPEHDE